MSDPLWRPILQMGMLLLTLGLYAALVAAIVVFARRVMRSGSQPGWVRLGLVVGGMLSLYALLSNALQTFLPAPDAGGNPNMFLVGTLPLLVTGMAGVVGGFSSGTTWRGASAGLLAGLLGVLADQASQVLMIALSWYAIQHHLGPAGMVSDYQQMARNLGHAPDLGAFFTREYLEDGLGLPIVFSLIAPTLEGLSATLGGWIGTSLRRAEAVRGQAARVAVATGAPARWLLLAVGLDVLVWLATVEFNALGGAHRVCGLSDLAHSLVTQGFGRWLLGFVVVLAFVLASGRLSVAAEGAGISRS